jgi:hypothetical protein
MPLLLNLCERMVSLVNCAPQDDAWGNIVSHAAQASCVGSNNATCHSAVVAQARHDKEIWHAMTRAHINCAMEAIEPTDQLTRRPHKHTWQRTHTSNALPSMNWVVKRAKPTGVMATSGA